MKRATAFLVLAALFAAGVLVGVLATHLFYLQRLKQPGSFADAASSIALRHLDRELDLTARQRVEVERILEGARGEAIRFRREVVAPEVLRILDETRGEIADMLEPEQREQLERLRRERRPKIERLLYGEPPEP